VVDLPAGRNRPRGAGAVGADLRREFADDESRWRAVLRRDRRADGAFCYSVLTTGTYSRPSCGSRHARRANTRFFPDPAAAERAGFRPCRRCHPDWGPWDAQVAAVVRSCRLMEAPGPAPSLGGLADATGLSRFHLHRVFAALTGVTPKAYATACRTERLHEEILRARTVTEAIYQAGFNSSGSFYAVAPQLLGMTPTAYRNRGRGTRIEHLPARSSLGPLLLATTSAGVCAVLFDQDAAALLPTLRGLFSSADLTPAGPAAAQRLTAALSRADRPPQCPQLPGDIRRRALGERVRAVAQLRAQAIDD
jgi:AraC family transcriptional regulator of adaptative response/methylated-DNA-[protein]-cysteine methyltransferase